MKLLLLAASAVLTLGSKWSDEIKTSELSIVGTFKSFQEWQLLFDKTYSSIEEESHRYLIWLDNLSKIASYNSEDLTFKLRMNQFGDLTNDEFKLYVHGKDGACFKKNELFNYENENENEILIKESEPVNAPASVDWRTQGVVTPVKNQGQCGSCWAFSATGAMECDYAIAHGTLTSLSEQQLVDCAGIRYGCSGCNGGQMYGAMEYAADEGGLCSESNYKYTARDGSCKATTCGTKYDAPSGKGYTAVTKDSETAMVNAAAAGCVSIGIEADQTAFQYYSSGVLTGLCGTNIDHGVLIVGYGTATVGGDYWWVKNSWGTSWGESGYVQICRNCNKNGSKGECGILTEGNVPNY